MKNISRWAIANPVATISLFIVLNIFGIYGYTQLRLNNFPDTDVPTVTVSVSQTGASPTELETQVTEIVENAVSGLEGIDTISSTVSEGVSQTSIEFALGTDIDRSLSDVQNAVNRIQGNLPSAASTPIVARVDMSGGAIITYVVNSASMSIDALSAFVDDTVGQRLMSADGVSSVQRSGGVDRVIWVKLIPDAMSALGISASDVSQTLANVNVNRPGGRVVVGAEEQTVRTLGSVSTISELEDMKINVGGNTSVRLGDIATVSDTSADPRQRARLDGREVVAFSVFRSVGSSEVHTTEAVRHAVEELQAAHPEIGITEVSSSTDFVVESYDAAIEALWVGALLAVVVVFAFLRDWRATLIAAVAMPLSLIPTFIVMHWLNLSLNTITLLALSLVVGILVDDAIVEIENIIRHMRQTGKGAMAAAQEAADEIGLAVVATTGTLVAVFMPVAFMPGVAGQIFLSFGVAVSVSVVFSLIVARMLTPLMGAYLLKSKHSEELSPRWVLWYQRLLGLALRHRWITLGLGIAFFVGSVSLAPLLPVAFFPATDRGSTSISVKLPPGSTLDETDQMVQRITGLFTEQEDVSLVYASLGTPTSAGIGASVSTTGAVNTATITVVLVPSEERSRSQQQFEADNAPVLARIAGARINFGGSELQGGGISITLVSSNSDTLTSTIETLRNQMATVSGLLNVRSSLDAASPELIVTPDKARAAELGVTPTQIAEAVNIATLGDSAARLPKFNAGDRQLSILVSLTKEALNDADKIALFPITTTKGTVPLGSIAEIGFGAGPDSITRVDRVRSAQVTADLSGLTLGEANTLVQQLPVMKDLPVGISTSDQGGVAQLAELVSGFIIAMGSGVLLMFLTLALLFRNFLHPVTILTALPLSIGGALGALVIAGSSLSISGFIGLLLLMGIAAKNSILLVEYALVEQAAGVPRREALLDAAAKRVRPIVMTSIAMAAGMLPIALGWGADTETRAPMAIAVIGGLVSSTALSLLYVPIVYTFMDDLQMWLRRKLGRLIVLPEQPENSAGQAK